MNKLTYTFFWRQANFGLLNRRNEAFAKALFSLNNNINHVEVVSFIEFFKLLKKLFQSRFRKEYRLQFSKIFYNLSLDNGFTLFTFIIIGGESIPFFAYINKVLIKLQLYRINFTNSNNVIVLYPPSPFDFIEKTLPSNSYILVDLVDDVINKSNLPTTRNKYLASYKHTLKLADYVTSTSNTHSTYYQKYSTSKKINFVPNGVDCDLFNIKFKSDFNVQPVIGYVGVINATFDFDSISQLVKNFPFCKFSFYGFTDGIGKVYISKLSNYSNFEFLGLLIQSDVPNFLNSCDILLMPKRNNRSTSGGDSIKIYQYLATGKHIISSSVSPSPNFPDLLYIANSPSEYCKSLSHALNNPPSPFLINARKLMASKFCWKYLVSPINSFFRDLSNVN